jgi:hypothetical protein
MIFDKKQLNRNRACGAAIEELDRRLLDFEDRIGIDATVY